jgi:carboxyl-terminal processing protease
LEDEATQDEDEEDEPVIDPLAVEEDTEEDDILLQEAGNVLVDALLIKERRFAAHTPKPE